MAGSRAVKGWRRARTTGCGLASSAWAVAAAATSMPGPAWTTSRSPRSATSTKATSARSSRFSRDATPRSRPHTSTSGRCSRTRRSMRCRSPRRTTGTRCRRSGLPGRQGRLRREALHAQRVRIAADRRRGPQVRTHRAAGQPEPVVTGAPGSREAAARRGIRRDLHGARPLLQVARHDRQDAGGAGPARSRLRPVARTRRQSAPSRKNRFHYNWHWFWDTGNGDLGNQGIHEVDKCRWGLGVTHPTKVTAIGGKFMFDDDQETPNTISASYEFDVDGKKKMMTFEVRHWISPHEAGHPGRQAGQYDRQPVLRLEGLPRHRQLQQVPTRSSAAISSRDRPRRRRHALAELHRRSPQPKRAGSQRRDRGRRAVLQSGSPGEHQLPPGPDDSLGRQKPGLHRRRRSEQDADAGLPRAVRRAAERVAAIRAHDNNRSSIASLRAVTSDRSAPAASACRAISPIGSVDPILPSRRRHLRRHHGHELHVRIERQARHVDAPPCATCPRPSAARP